MSLASFSHWLDQATQPKHPDYHLLQATLFASLAYVSTACFTSISPKRSALLTVSTYTISQLVTPLFCQLLEPYRDISLVPLMGQVAQLTTSVLLANATCHLFKQSLSFQDIRHVSLVFGSSLYVSHFALLKIRQQLYQRT